MQYTDRGNVPGISGGVDRDIYTKEIFLDNNEEIPSIENPNDTINTESQYYTVEKGDTLWEIAQKFGTTVQEIANINNLENPNLIYPGQKLRITESTNTSLNPMPQTSSGYYTYTVQRGDTLWRIARRYGVSVRYIVRLNVTFSYIMVLYK